MTSVYVSLELTHESLVDDVEPSRFVKDVSGKIYVYEGEVRVMAGRVVMYILDVQQAIREDYDVFDVFDHLAETMPYWDLYGPHFEYSRAVRKVVDVDNRWGPNLLILDRLELLPAFRGKGVGLQIIAWLKMQFAMGCGLVAMKPFPLQCEGRPSSYAGDAEMHDLLELNHYDQNYNRSVSKLRRHYGRLGFVRVPGTDLMVANPWSETEVP